MTRVRKHDDLADLEQMGLKLDGMRKRHGGSRVLIAIGDAIKAVRDAHYEVRRNRDATRPREPVKVPDESDY